MKKIIFILLIATCASWSVFGQTVTPSTTLLRPSASLPAACTPYQIRAHSTGARICKSDGSGWDYLLGNGASLLTAGRLPYVGTGGVLSDSANATLSSTGALAVGSTSNGGSALLTLQGYSYNATNGSFGRLLFYGNNNASSSTRQWLITNATSRLRIIRSTDSSTTPGLNSSAVVTGGTEDFSIDENGEVSLRTSGSVGTTTDGGSALLTLQGYSANGANGIYGRLLFNANGNHTGDARRWLVTNALNKFRIIRSADATTAPAINSSGSVTSGTESFSIDKDGAVAIAGTLGVGANFTVTSGDVITATAGKTIQIKTGSNACSGSATLSSGTATVSTTCTGTTWGTNFIVILTPYGSSTGALRVSSFTGSTSFVITSTDGASTDAVGWTIIKQN